MTTSNVNIVLTTPKSKIVKDPLNWTKWPLVKAGPTCPSLNYKPGTRLQLMSKSFNETFTLVNCDQSTNESTYHKDLILFKKFMFLLTIFHHIFKSKV